MINHLLVTPDGKRFAFLHRWRGVGEGKNRRTRMLTANADGSGLRVPFPSGRVSRFVLPDPKHILAYAGYASEARPWRFQVFDAGLPAGYFAHYWLSAWYRCGMKVFMP